MMVKAALEDQPGRQPSDIMADLVLDYFEVKERRRPLLGIDWWRACSSCQRAHDSDNQLR